MNIPTTPSRSMGIRSSYSMKVQHQQWATQTPSHYPVEFVLTLIPSRSDPDRLRFSQLITSQSRKTTINLNLRGQRSFGIDLGMSLAQVWVETPGDIARVVYPKQSGYSGKKS
ncbi:hypothetical protein CR513_09935, partial [Mucuna pruriens]